MNSINPEIVTALTACISRLKWHEENLTSFPLDVAARKRAEAALEAARHGNALPLTGTALVVEQARIFGNQV